MNQLSNLSKKEKKYIFIINFLSFLLLINSIVTTEGGGFKPWISQLETLRDMRCQGFGLFIINFKLIKRSPYV